jgi:hypothetical protein
MTIEWGDRAHRKSNADRYLDRSYVTRRRSTAAEGMEDDKVEVVTTFKVQHRTKHYKVVQEAKNAVRRKSIVSPHSLARMKMRRTWRGIWRSYLQASEAW